VTVPHLAASIAYPRRLLVRGTLRSLLKAAYGVLVDLDVQGRENLPQKGPLLVVANHFSFLDPSMVIRVTSWPLEFIAGTQRPNAPAWVRWLPEMWGVLTTHRGTGARGALRGAESVLEQGGILGIFPEGGNWATVLRPARPGAAYLAARSGAPLLPIGLDGLTEVFPSLQRGRRARVTVRIGKAFGPFLPSGRGSNRRQQLEGFGHEIMGRIATLIPPERRGHYAADPAVRAAAKGTEVYPWADVEED
jgi:1-acyl-sn-glycerol-3-phosphate acyltransferase